MFRRDVDQARVEEAGGQQAPIFGVEPSRHVSGPNSAPWSEHPTAVRAAERDAGRDLGEEHDHVDRDQDLGDDRPPSRVSRLVPTFVFSPRALGAAHARPTSASCSRGRSAARRTSTRRRSHAIGVSVADGHRSPDDASSAPVTASGVSGPGGSGASPVRCPRASRPRGRAARRIPACGRGGGSGRVGRSARFPRSR